MTRTLAAKELHEFEESRKTVYVTSIERIGREDGLKEGLKQGQATVLLRQIERKFGAAAVAACRDRFE